MDITAGLDVRVDRDRNKGTFFLPPRAPVTKTGVRNGGAVA
jgi:hypothetical protein